MTTDHAMSCITSIIIFFLGLHIIFLFMLFVWFEGVTKHFIKGSSNQNFEMGNFIGNSFFFFSGKLKIGQITRFQCFTLSQDNALICFLNENESLCFHTVWKHFSCGIKFQEVLMHASLMLTTDAMLYASIPCYIKLCIIVCRTWF